MVRIAMRVLWVAKRALGPFGTEAGEVLWTRLLARMPVPAALPMLAKASRVPRAVGLILVTSHVQEDALFVAALAKLAKVPALWHAVVVEAV